MSGPEPAAPPPSLDEILDRLQSGAPVSPDDMALHLTVGPPGERIANNARIALSLLASGRAADARRFAERAWTLSRHAPQLLDLFHATLGQDLEAKRKSLRDAARRTAREGQIGATIGLLDHYTHFRAINGHDNWYEFDWDALASLRALAERWACPRRPIEPLEGRRLKVAILIYGADHVGSIITREAVAFASHHDRNRVDLRFYVPVPRERVSPSSLAELARAAEQGVAVEFAPSDAGDTALVALGHGIARWGADILFTTAVLASTALYFVQSLRPAHVNVALVQGQIPIYTSPETDFAILRRAEYALDCPCECAHIPHEMELPDLASVHPASRRDIGVPEDAFVIAASGRTVKFASPQYWDMITGALMRRPDAWFVAIGPGTPDGSTPQVPLSAPEDVLTRIRFLPWTPTPLSFISLADVVVDTFPIGGSATLAEAMALGKPCIGFRRPAMIFYDHNDHGDNGMVLQLPELRVPLGDRNAFISLVDRLGSDAAFRTELGKACQRQVHEVYGQPWRSVARYEAIWFDLIRRRLEGAA
ncbi:tetratricopeptide repeat protein [Arenibaculum pallidiluteum]|uniref:hypothetical protein n=1 Tax=Arenibaculum pallidiluteum TaxID=2812559 RepID=UPI001A9686AC|nr:hypothetical protein [Arenibaculum pallidiluteum]